MVSEQLGAGSTEDGLLWQHDRLKLRCPLPSICLWGEHRHSMHPYMAKRNQITCPTMGQHHTNQMLHETGFVSKAILCLKRNPWPSKSKWLPHHTSRGGGHPASKPRKHPQRGQRGARHPTPTPIHQRATCHTDCLGLFIVFFGGKCDFR